MTASDGQRGQVNHSAAEVYEEFFVPALFQEWVSRVAEVAEIRPGQNVLDVACGTGVLAREAAGRVGESGAVTGLDVNDGMLAVAWQKASEIEWRRGRAEELPFDDHEFDAVISQFGLMFFEDRRRAIREMVRVLRPGGHLAVAVWDSLENCSGYAAVVDIMERLFSNPAADAVRAPFVLGHRDQLISLFSGVGLTDMAVRTFRGTAQYPSIQSWMYTDVRGWTLANMIDEDQYALLLDEAQPVLQPFVNGDGSVSFDMPAHIVTGRKVWTLL